MRHGNWREYPRKEILRTLNSSIASRVLTVVVAPAGYGKTVMAHKLAGPKLADGKQRRLFFHSIPREASSVRERWDSLFASLAHQGMENAREIRRIGFPQDASMTRQAIELLENVPPFLLILDDFHHLADPAIDAFLETVVRAEPSEHRFALFSRAIPRMRLDELEREGLAAVHTRELLEFSETDAARFFFLNGVADGEAARRAWRYSEGWITALWLCLLDRKTGGTATPSGDIENLLEAAVFAGYPAEEQDFLLRLSVLESFTAKEAEAISSRKDADGVLRDMAGGNALIRRDDSGKSYVFHSIFHDFLAKKRASRIDLDTPDLYRGAAECHIRRRDFLPAFRFLVRAGRDEDLLRILDVVASAGEQNIYNMHRDDILPLIEKIPWRIRVRQPFGYFHCVWLCEGIDAAGSPGLFVEMAERFAAAKEIPAHARSRLEGEMEQMRGWLYLDGDPRLLVTHYRRAREILDGPSLIREEQRCWNYGTPHMLGAYLREGVRYPELRETVETAHQSVRVLTGYIAEGTSLIADMEYRVERGEFGAAESLLDELDQALDFPRNMTSLVMARFQRARLLSLRDGADNADNAALLLTDLIKDIKATGSSEHVQCAELALGFVLANLGRADAAPRWLRDGDIFGRPYCAKSDLGFMAAVHSKLLLAKGDRDGLAAILAGNPPAFGNPGLAFRGMHAAVIGAIAAWHRGDGEAAARLLREAVELSRLNGFLLPVAEYGGHVLPVLRRLAGERPIDAHQRAIIELAERIAALQRNRERDAARAFTDRERDIMRLVAKGKSAAAIADKLGSTQPSINNAMTRLYAKMGVKNRTEAARLFQNAFRREKKKESAPVAEPENRDERMEAFRALLRPGREEDLARALELFGPSGAGAGSGETMAFHFREIRDAVRTFPWAVRLTRPLAYLAFLRRQFLAFDRGTSGVDLDEAEYRLSRTGRSGGGLAGEIALLRSLLRAHDAETLWNGYAAAAKLIGRPSRLHSREASWTFGNPHSSFIAVREPGDFDRLAEPAVAASSALAALSGGECVSLDAAFRMERHLERGELPEARALLSRLESRGERDIQTCIVSAFACARLLLADGLPTMAVAGLEGIAPRVRALHSFEHAESLYLALGYVHAHLGRIDAVPQWIRSGKTATLPHGAAARTPFACVVYGKSLLAAGDFARLRAAARAMPARFGGFDSLIGRIHAKVLEAIAEKNLRRENDALSRLAEAVELSRRDGLVFPIAEYREHVLSLLRHLRRERPGGHIERVMTFALRKYRSASFENEGDGGARRRRILTPREREILDLAARGKSNHEIACQLGVSGSRVINALTRIYGKIGVSNRVEASLWFAREYKRSMET